MTRIDKTKVEKKKNNLQAKYRVVHKIANDYSIPYQFLLKFVNFIYKYEIKTEKITWDSNTKDHFLISRIAKSIQHYSKQFFLKYGRNGVFYLEEKDVKYIHSNNDCDDDKYIFTWYIVSNILAGNCWAINTNIIKLTKILVDCNVEEFLNDDQKFPSLIDPKSKNIRLYKENYRNWKMYFSRYNYEKAWPQSKYIKSSDSGYFGDTGCFVCSIAIMLRKHNIVKENDDEVFNPWILHKIFEKNDLYYPNAALKYVNVDKVIPIKAVSTDPYSLNAIKELHKTYMCIIIVSGYNHKHHYVCFDKIIDDEVYIIDCYSHKTKLSEYWKVYYIVTFKKIEENFNSNFINV